ncbi:MAG: ABC transporter substrate-binding protein [Planctomycetota bacterium]
MGPASSRRTSPSTTAPRCRASDPAKVTGVPEGRVIRCLYEGLVIKDPKDLSPVPGVAKSWDISEDKKTYTFHLRDNASWSNGDPVTAQDFEWSMKRMLDPETAAEYAYQLWYEGREGLHHRGVPRRP